MDDRQDSPNGTSDRGSPWPTRHWSRRELLAATAGAAAALALARSLRAALRRALPDEPLLIGVVLPRPAGAARAPVAPAESAVMGVELGAEEVTRTAALFGRRVMLTYRTGGSVPDARAALDGMVANLRVPAVVGAVGERESAELAARADLRGVLFANASSASDALRGAGCRRHAFHVQASDAMRVDALVRGLARERRMLRWFLIGADPRTPDAARRRTRRVLGAHGATEVGSADIAPGPADPSDALRAVGRAAPDVVLILPGVDGRQFLERYAAAGLRAAVADAGATGLPASGNAVRVVRAELWHHALERFGAAQLNDRFRARFGREMDGAAWAGWAAVKIVWEAALRARATEPAALVAYLERESAHFDGHKGRPLTFRAWDHQLRQPLYLVEAAGEGGADGERVIAEVPAAALGSAQPSRDLLDEIGDAAAATACRWDA